MGSLRHVDHVHEYKLPPAYPKSGGRLPASTHKWVAPANQSLATQLLPDIEKYLLADDDGPHLPYGFVCRVVDVASEALRNAGAYAIKGTNVQVNCHIVGIGKDRRLTLSVYNEVERTRFQQLPDRQSIPAPDLNGNVTTTHGRGLPLMQARSDGFLIYPILGHAIETRLIFDLNSPLA